MEIWLVVVLCIIIILLIIYYWRKYKQYLEDKKNASWPERISNCPDYWEDLGKNKCRNVNNIGLCPSWKKLDGEKCTPKTGSNVTIIKNVADVDDCLNRAKINTNGVSYNESGKMCTLYNTCTPRQGYVSDNDFYVKPENPGAGTLLSQGEIDFTPYKNASDKCRFTRRCKTSWEGIDTTCA